MNIRLIDLIEEEFKALIKSKKQYTKNEILKAYNKAVSRAVLRFINEAGL